MEVRWKDTAIDEDEYRIQRKIGDGAWTDVATVTPKPNGKYDHYEETGVDTSSPNRFYRLRSYRSSDDSFSDYSEVCNNPRITTSDNYRYFYGLEGIDECPPIDGNDACLADDNEDGKNIYLDLQETALEGSLDAFTRLGYTRDASAPPSGLDKIPINVVWCDGGGCAGGGGLGLSPLLMETDFDLDTRVGDPIPWLVALHEAYHFQQFKYWGLDDPAGRWVFEAQARMVQDKMCIGGDRSTAECFDDIDTGNSGYVPELKAYLGNPNRPITQVSYNAVLFWAYLTEKYGTSDPGDSVEAGLDLLREFWEASYDNPGLDGIATLNIALSNLGHSETFRDIWKDFAVANYAKDLSGPGVPDKYQYADMAEPGGNYGPVDLALDENLDLGEQFVDTDESVSQWGAVYYEMRPAADVPIIDVKINQDSAVQLYYTVLGVKGGDLAYEHNQESRDLDHTLINDGYDDVVVVVAGLDNPANYRYSFNGTQPELHILSPTTGNKAKVGDPASPDKFLVQLEVVNSEGVPLEGVNLDSFNFQIGAKDVPSGNILTSATVQGQHWFVLRAVTQDAAGQYDLSADYSGTINASQANAVDYSPRDDADSMLVIDRSGSMSFDLKLDSAQDAARLFVDSWREGDKLGVLSFSTNPSDPVDMGLTDWTDSPGGGSRQDAFDAINALVASGGTNIGDSLRVGWDELDGKGDAGHDWALVLLSDGNEEASSPTESFDDLIKALDDAAGKKPVVHTVAVGPDADRPRMQKAASKTGGTYQFVSTPSSLVTSHGITAIADLGLDLDARYRAIATDIIGQQQFYSYVGPNDSDGDVYSDTLRIPVEGSAGEMVLSLSWNPQTGFGFVPWLFDPHDNPVDYTRFDSRHLIWRISTPTPGEWRMVIQVFNLAASSPETPSGEVIPDYLVQASLRSDVTMDVYLTTPVEERTPGAPMGIVVSLTDTGPISGASVEATVEMPDGVTFNSLSLYDDGAHNDGAANDGIYANTYLQTGQHGSYNVTIDAAGTSPVSGAFTRQEWLSFHLEGGVDNDSNGYPDPGTIDTDLDGLPDLWEQRYGTDPNVPDANGDPDLDYVFNSDELVRGTDPHDSDTDDGGESDFSDDDPLDPSDDKVEPIWEVAYPGDGVVYIKYVDNPNWWYTYLNRSDQGPDGPYVLQNFVEGGVYTDTNVVNGTPYCYMMQVFTYGGAFSANSAPTCVTPKVDPLPPHGYVLINGGAQSTLSTDVELTLWASDAVDPHNEEIELFLPPADSASGVTEMKVSNQPDLGSASWEPYATSKPWTLGQSSGLATVYVQYRDAAGNESDVEVATIHVGSGPGIESIYLPVISR
ncbi:MAG: VWA domain-containing protein [Anaerolineales bacterium]